MKGVSWPGCDPSMPGCTMPVLSSTSAIDEMMFLAGSQDLKPQVSFRSNPLPSAANSYQGTLRIAHLIHSISMRCCSAMLFSLFTFRCNAVKMLVRSSSARPHCRLSSRNSSLASPLVMSVRASAPGVVMLKYSSSSRRTMMACLDSRGFCDVSVMLSLGFRGMVDCAWKRPGWVGVP